jgi:hypothetical protein
MLPAVAGRKRRANCKQRAARTCVRFNRGAHRRILSTDAVTLLISHFTSRSGGCR